MITIAVPTYNNFNLLKIMSASLYQSDLSMPHNIRIYDDCSTEYGVNELRELFPTAVSIHRNTANVRADRNIYIMYKDFLATSDNYFFNADSDIIFNKKWLSTAFNLLSETKGVLSVFNASSHPVKRILGNGLCIKETIGAAGTLITREKVADLLTVFDHEDSVLSFDWLCSQYFTSHGIDIYCTNSSLVQHIGYHGQNYVSGFFDYGMNFDVEDAKTGQTINDIFELFLIRNREYHIQIMKKTRKNLFLRIIKKLYKEFIDKYS
jgi:glycosyltransferase involved in cell wall biosynthesis